MHRHPEKHFAERIGWLRAAVMGANDGILSTSSLLVGVASAHAAREELLLAGMAGLVAGAMSMAAGEFVSVSSQSDAENADLERERLELKHDYQHELVELQGIYEARGVEHELALEVARQLMEHDALGAHARDELGLLDTNAARPTEAALASALTFAMGASLPLSIAWLGPISTIAPWVALGSLGCLALLGGLAAHVGGARISTGVLRVTFWGALAMGASAAIGSSFESLIN